MLLPELRLFRGLHSSIAVYRLFHAVEPESRRASIFDPFVFIVFIFIPPYLFSLWQLNEVNHITFFITLLQKKAQSC